MKEELLSIIVPIYNTKEYLNRCVDSILKQTYPDVEILLVDDGSTDGSGEICDAYEQQYPDKIRVIHKPNGGLSDARNAGIAASSGRYIGFVDSDDYIHSQMYEVMIREMKEREADIVSCAYYHIYDYMQEETLAAYHVTEADYKQALEKMILWESFDISVWSKLFKREMIEGIPFPKGKICEDEFWTYRTYFRAKKLLHLDFPFYYYQQGRKDSILSKPFDESRYDSTEALFERLHYLEEHEPDLVKLAGASIIEHFFFCFRATALLDPRPIDVWKPMFMHYAYMFKEQPAYMLAEYKKKSLKKFIQGTASQMLLFIHPQVFWAVYTFSIRLAKRGKKVERVVKKNG